MKQRLSLEDLTGLSEYQRDRLNDLWMPQKYDVAAGILCKDAENNEYDIFEFVIGEVVVQETNRGYYMTIWNLEAMRTAAESDLTIEEEEAEMEEPAEDFSFEYFRPDFYSKCDCMPLLSIGQLLELLSRIGYSREGYYLDIRPEGQNSGIGKDITQYEAYGNDYEGEELCDILWQALKEAL